MEYTIVDLEEKVVFGFKTKTSNVDPQIGEKIGELWNKLFQIPQAEKLQTMIGLYYEYEGDFSKPYSCLVGWTQTTEQETQDAYEKAIIKKGRYARFVIADNSLEKIQEFWENLWKIDLPRKYETDFEQYQKTDEKEAICVYIGLQDSTI